MSEGYLTRLCWSLGAVLVLVLPTILLGAVLPAAAAQIEVTNCQSKRVKMCSYDNTWSDKPNQSHLMAKGESAHFTCDANCKFWILECASGTCHACKGGFGYWLDHSWGRGSYGLMSLALTSDKYNPAYESSDLVKDASCP